ncbi:hypothetical protein PILCRDRAFT_657750 [Piloderma croceum F 1598]|uniref:Uncharacterized protein n=1 Tax=Piloderma croceum (strain F 1598) TaxID=765440 RepID=A0A0C3BFH4_PILCF|nr:hypothetical protein PILCRDRAFT_657750 [Piloderma croceum F 1598]
MRTYLLVPESIPECSQIAAGQLKTLRQLNERSTTHAARGRDFSHGSNLKFRNFGSEVVVNVTRLTPCIVKKSRLVVIVAVRQHITRLSVIVDSLVVDLGSGTAGHPYPT